MARQAKVEDIMIPVFEGTNYTSWKLRLMTLLDYKECKDQATRNIDDEDKEVENWKKKDLKARAILMSAVTDKQLEFIGECKTAHDMIAKFDSMYLTKSTSLQIICRGKLEEIKLKNYEQVDDFFAEFEKAVNEFKSAGGKLEETEKMRYLIRALPPSYSYIGDFIDIIPEKERTVDYVKAKIKEKNMTKYNFDKKGNMSTFTAKFEGKCYSCGKAGHRQRDCPSQQASRGRGSQPGRHNNGYRGSSRGRGAQPSRGRGSGRPPGHSRGETSSSQRSSTTTEAESAEAWATIVDRPQINQVTGCDYSDDCNEIHWLLDSGCTDNIVQTDRFFYEYKNVNESKFVTLPDGKKLKATKVGTIRLQFKNYYNVTTVDLKNVYYVKGIKQNLISMSKVTKTCTVVARDDNAKIYNQARKLVAVAHKKEDLYILKSFVMRSLNNETYVNTVKLTDKEKWHRALGHVNFQYLNKLVNEKLVEGLPNKIENIEMKCANCIESKMANVPFKNNRSKTREILELIHTDLNGPHKIEGYGGEKYFLTFIDDFSKCTRIFCIKSKSETASCFIEFVNLVENIFDKRVKKLQCDNGKEYLNKEIYEFIKFKGIQLLPCPPYVHELNGVAERYNRSAMDIGRCLIREAKIHRRYWPEVIKTVAYLKNRTIANTQENKTPYEIFFNRKPNVEHLKIYGSRVFVRVPEALRNSKWDNKAELGILVGYTENGYRVLVNNRVINARHVQIVEENVKLICLEKSDDEKDREIEESENNEIDENSDNDESDKIEIDENDREINNNENVENLKVQRKSERKKSPVSRYGNPITHCIYVNYVNANTPNTFAEAINSSDCKEWQKAMDSELDSLIKNNTWEIVDKPKGKKVIDVKWVYNRKNDNKYKARLVVRGFQQKEHIENVYSPVGKMQTLKILLSYCCKNRMFIDQMDVETAFLNGRVKSEVYISAPKGYKTSADKVLKLKKALYGLSESPRAWYECFDEYMQKLKFERSNYDYCLYTNNEGKDPIYILVFVDDLLICCKDRDIINKIKEKLMQRFAIKDLGKVGQYIGINIYYNNERTKMTLSQTNYIESLAQKYKLEIARLYDTPMETNLKLDQASEADERIKYRNLIGELLYISAGTRPDISYSVNYLSRYQNCYDETHFKYAMRILKYLFKTKDLKLIYYCDLESDTLDCMVDSDYAGDNVDRKSTTGFVIRLYGNLIYWKTRKQNTVTKCSTFAEYTAMSEAVTEILFIRNLLSESFKVKFESAVKMYEDNSGAVAIAKFGNFTKNSKHIEVQYHYINENYENKTIDIVKIDTESNLADMLTKSQTKAKFIKNREALNLKIM